MAKRLVQTGFIVLFFAFSYAPAQAPESRLTKQDHEWLTHVLNTVRDEIKKNYYDPSFHGINVDQRFLQAETKIASAPDRNYAVADIAGAVTALNDSHTLFLPSARPYTHEYGWRMQAIGDSDCFITAVRPGSDAEKKGLKPGDQVLSVAGYAASAVICGR
jgi:C-terminal processing protease CtpA/Prc